MDATIYCTINNNNITKTLVNNSKLHNVLL